MSSTEAPHVDGGSELKQRRALIAGAAATGEATAVVAALASPS